jgi:NADH-quinone oxidoreductase subunit J
MLTLVFALLAAGAILTAGALIFSRNPVYAVMFMVLHFTLTAALFLLLRSSFIAAVQVIVYAGAVMVLFLFVIMLFGGRRVSLDEPLGGQRRLAVVLSVALLAILGYALVDYAPPQVAATFRTPPAGDVSPQLADFGSTATIARELYSTYALPLEIVSLLLLVAMIGAVIIAGRTQHGVGEDAPESRAHAAPPSSV